jgi:hypothetical protein
VVTSVIGGQSSQEVAERTGLFPSRDGEIHPAFPKINLFLVACGYRQALTRGLGLGKTKAMPEWDLRTGARHMTSLDAAKARLDQALARLTDEVAATTARAAGRFDTVDRSAHDALARDYEILREERDGLAARLHEAEQRIADLARNADELGRRLSGAIAKVERLMES